MDEATKFIIDAGEADLIYLDGLSKYPDVTIGASQIPEYLGLPEPLKDIFREAISKILYPSMYKIISPRVDAIKEIINNSDNVECIHDELTYDLKEYLINAEVPFVISLAKDTELKDNVKIPDNLYEKMREVHSIPLCRKHKPAITQMIKGIM